MRNLGTNKLLWLLLAGFSFVAAVIGVANPGGYDRVVTRGVMPGVLSQDWMTVGAAIAMAILAIRVGERDVAAQLVVLGIVGFLFYAYGIYVIERIYNALYLVYMAIFGLSFYALIYGVASIHVERLISVEVPGIIRGVAVGFLLFVALVFNALWIGRLMPMMQSGQKPEFYYSILILDLCFIMPAFVIVAIRTIRRDALATLLVPALFVVGFTLLAPVGLGELLKPAYGLPIDTGGLVLYLSLSMLFLALAAVYLARLKIGWMPT